MSKQELVRGIGRWDLTAVAINTIIGAGIFGLPSKVYALIGSYSLFAFAACALVIGLIVLCHAEVASRFSSTGGPYLYAREAFGPLVGFEVGWLYWIVRVTTFAANCNLLVTYAGFFFPAVVEPAGRWAVIVAVVILITAVNIFGVKPTAHVTNAFTIGKILPLLLLVFAGLFYFQPANFNFDVVPGYDAFSSAVLLLIYAFVGFEVAVVVAGETKEPQKTMPFALLTALGIVAVLYIAIQVVSIATLPGLAASERPLADAAAASMGPIGAGLITIGALISILGNLNVGMLGGTRLLYAMSERGEIPAVVSRTHERFRTPYISIVVTAMVMFVLTIQSSFITALTIATTTRLLVYATTCLALPVFRRRRDMPEARFRVPLGIAAAVISLALIGWLLTRVDLAREGVAMAALAVGGLIIFGITKLGTKPPSPE